MSVNSANATLMVTAQGQVAQLVAAMNQAGGAVINLGNQTMTVNQKIATSSRAAVQGTKDQITAGQALAAQKRLVQNEIARLILQMQREGQASLETGRYLEQLQGQLAGLTASTKAHTAASKTNSQQQQAEMTASQKLAYTKRLMREEMARLTLEIHRQGPATKQLQAELAALQGQYMRLSNGAMGAASGVGGLNLAMRGAAATVAIFDPRTSVLISHFAYFENALPNKVIPAFVALGSTLAVLAVSIGAMTAGGRMTSAAKSFEAMAGSAENAARWVRQFKEASAGVLTETEILTTTAAPIALGLDPDKVAILLDRVRVLSKSFGLDFKEQWEQTVHGVVRKEIELLDQLGVSFKAMEVSAMSSAEILDEVLRQMGRNVQALGGDIRSADEDYKALWATLRDVWNQQLMDWSQSPHMQWLRDLPRYINEGILAYKSMNSWQLTVAAFSGSYTPQVIGGAAAPPGNPTLQQAAQQSGRPKVGGHYVAVTQAVPWLPFYQARIMGGEVAFPSGQSYQYNEAAYKEAQRLAKQSVGQGYGFFGGQQIVESDPAYQRALEAAYRDQMEARNLPMPAPTATKPSTPAVMGPPAPASLEERMKGADYLQTTPGGPLYDRRGRLVQGITAGEATSKGRVIANVWESDIAFLQREHREVSGGGGRAAAKPKTERYVATDQERRLARAFGVETPTSDAERVALYSRLRRPDGKLDKLALLRALRPNATINPALIPDGALATSVLLGYDFARGGELQDPDRIALIKRGQYAPEPYVSPEPVSRLYKDILQMRHDAMLAGGTPFSAANVPRQASISFLSGLGELATPDQRRMLKRLQRLDKRDEGYQTGVQNLLMAGMMGDRSGVAGAIGGLAGTAIGTAGGTLGAIFGSALPFVGTLVGAGIGKALDNLFARRQLSKSELLSVRIESMSPQAAMQLGSITFARLSGLANGATNLGAMQLAGQVA